MRTLKQLSSQQLKGQRILLREDFNVPMQEGKILSDARLKAALPTLQMLMKAQAAVMVMSHLGRPEAGKTDSKYSLAPIAERLSALLKQPVRLVIDWIDGVEVRSGEVVVLENVRFLKGETENQASVAKKMAKLCDVFVMDAFATAHRAQASTVGVIEYAPEAVAGPLLVEELEALDRALKKPKHPLVSILGGAKISGKIEVIDHLLTVSDTLILGGGLANTFIAAQGHAVGQSLYEPEQVPRAKSILRKAKEKKWSILIPSDVMVATELSAQALPQVRNVHEVKAHEKILDIGPNTSMLCSGILSDAKTILWNGPMGVFEYKPFAQGTLLMAKMVGESDAFSVVGGGETLAAVEQAGVSDWISYQSTGGGAFLEYCEGKMLPAIDALNRKHP